MINKNIMKLERDDFKNRNEIDFVKWVCNPEYLCSCTSYACCSDLKLII